VPDLTHQTTDPTAPHPQVPHKFCLRCGKLRPDLTERCPVRVTEAALDLAERAIGATDPGERAALRVQVAILRGEA
jgi:hypothetical protein